MVTANESTPPDLREGVRSGIIGAIDRDAELRGARTARLLVTAGALGIFGAIGVVRMLSGHPYGHHPAWHVVVFTALWSGLLVVTFAMALLRVRTPSMPLARAACVGLLGLGFAGICSAFCPDQHFLDWWSSTPAGSTLNAIGGLPLSALCFGGMTTLVFGAASALIAMRSRRTHPIRPLLPAALLLLLLLPGVALQSFGASWLVFASWLVGTAAGAYAGVAIGIGVRNRLVLA
jgi:hypothetical protein